MEIPEPAALKSKELSHKAALETLHSCQITQSSCLFELARSFAKLGSIIIQSSIYGLKYGSFLSRLLSFVFLARSATGLLGLEGRERSQVDFLLR